MNFEGREAALEGQVAQLQSELAVALRERDQWRARAELAVTPPKPLTEEQIAYGRDVVAPRIESEAVKAEVLKERQRCWDIWYSNPTGQTVGDRIKSGEPSDAWRPPLKPGR
jgi:hypothetical protein